MAGDWTELGGVIQELRDQIGHWGMSVKAIPVIMGTWIFTLSKVENRWRIWGRGFLC